MVRRVMVVVLLGCVGLTTGVALGTLFPSGVISTPTTTTTVCQHFGCLSDLTVPYRLIHRGLPMGGYVLLGLLAGLSTALGFLVPPGRARPRGDGMRRRMLGTALTVVGILMLLFAPVHLVEGCVYSFDSGSCGIDQGSSSVWGWVDYPAGRYWAILPMVVIGVALVVTGVVLLVKRGRSRRSPLVG